MPWARLVPRGTELGFGRKDLGHTGSIHVDRVEWSFLAWILRNVIQVPGPVGVKDRAKATNATSMISWEKKTGASQLESCNYKRRR